MAQRPASKTVKPAGPRKRRRDSSDDERPNTPAKKAARKQFEERETTLEQAQQYRILTAKMPVEALAADWSVARNRVIRGEHVKALCKIFTQGGLNRAGHHVAVLATRSEVECMLRLMELHDEVTDADDIPAFDDWLSVNRPVELMDGQHRVAALERYVSETGADKKELWWPCDFYDRDTLPPKLNLELRMNRQDAMMADSHGDIWVQLVAAASEKPGMFHGNDDEMKAQMRRALRLSGEPGFPQHRLATIWRNERWRQMATRWCQTTVGRATFQISTWDWMIRLRIDDFWFMAFRRVLDTLAQLPCDAARLVSSQDWKEMSASLGAERTQEQVQELFYPGRSGKSVSDASERNPKLLRAFDHRGYWEVYERILRTPALRFPDIHRITGLSQGQGRVLLQVLSHVVDWLNDKRTKMAKSRSNDKPPLRKDLEPALDYYTPARLRQAEKRLKVFFPPATPPQSSLESASVLLQQEVLEYVLEHLAAFNAPTMRDYLKDGDPDSDLYAARFREDTWAGVLKIVRWHVSECRPQWLPVEGSDKAPEAEPSTQAADLTDALCNYDSGLSAVREKLHSKLQSSVFRSAFAAWLSEQCGGEPDGEEMPPDDGAWGSKSSPADDDGSTVLVAPAAAATSPGVDRPVVDPKPAARAAVKAAAKPNATRDAPAPQADGHRGTARSRPQGKSEVNGRYWIRREKCSGGNTTPQRHGVKPGMTRKLVG
ncbi:Maltose permease MAL31 [Purpureocillium lavendulum]|uniref:Maltose permease MAL31 n=1 Tax=Purpureocillium lavendulum TaxID=1247861 RepID=A0AB34FE30_9HYPO|nr:Maltose permease MAL31 [Purpureocillium lavendulum]